MPERRFRPGCKILEALEGGVCRHARGVDVDMVVDLAERQQSPQYLRRFFVFRLLTMKQKTRQYVARNNMANGKPEGGGRGKLQGICAGDIVAAVV